MGKTDLVLIPATAGVLLTDTALNLQVKETDLKGEGEGDLGHRLLARRAWKLDQRGFAYFTIMVSAKRQPKSAP